MGRGVKERGGGGKSQFSEASLVACIQREEVTEGRVPLAWVGAPMDSLGLSS